MTQSVAKVTINDWSQAAGSFDNFFCGEVLVNISNSYSVVSSQLKCMDYEERVLPFAKFVEPHTDLSQSSSAASLSPSESIDVQTALFSQCLTGHRQDKQPPKPVTGIES